MKIMKKHSTIIRGALQGAGVALGLLALSALCTLAARAQAPLVLADNMKVLRAQMPDTSYRFVGSNAPGQLFYADEPVNLKFVFTKGTDAGAVGDFALEVQEITTRDPAAKAGGAATDTSGDAPLIALAGKPLRVPLAVTFGAGAETPVSLANFPLPKRFGTYAVVLTRGAGATQARQFLATLARVPRPNARGTIDNTPIFGEGQMMDDPKLIDQRAAQYFRMGVRGWRSEMSWIQKTDGTTDWTNTDALFGAAAKNGMGIMVTLGGVQSQWMPLGVPIPAAGWTPQTAGYSGTGDWLMAPEQYPAYGAWIEQLAARYYKDGKGGLWGFENYNEPWEGGGISGWARDARQYRALQETIARAARAVSPDIKVLAASSIMNTEDKLYCDGSDTMDKYIDIFTDHYVVPTMSYGPMVARAHGKKSMETETWFVNSEFLLPQGVTQFMAAGQAHIAPWHPRVLFDKLPGTNDNYFIPTPTVAATAAFNALVTGKTFNKMVFQNHLPFVFQFGADADRDALLVVFGNLLTIGGNDPKEQIWAQVNRESGGTLTIDNRDGLLQFFDPAGNPMFEKQKTVTLPLSVAATYIKSTKGPVAAAARLASAKMVGRRPVEIIPHDFGSAMGAGSVLKVEVHNALNRPITGALQITAPATLVVKGAATQNVALGAGESKTLAFAVGLNPAADAQRPNSYPFGFNFVSDVAKASYSENINAAIAPRGTKIVDGNLDDWNDVPGVTALGTTEKIDPTELLRRPWLAVSSDNPTATVGEVKMAWDENTLYVAARVQDPTSETANFRFAARDENAYFHSAADDQIEPYKTFIEERRVTLGKPDLSFGQFPYVYRSSPETGIPFRRDRLLIALDVAPGYHDMKPIPGVPDGFHAVPDTDYEYSIFATDEGAEVWRHLAPGVARIHDFPRQVRTARTTGDVPDAWEMGDYRLISREQSEEKAVLRFSMTQIQRGPMDGSRSASASGDFGLVEGASTRARCLAGIGTAPA